MSQPSEPFTIGLVQDAATSDREANIARAERLVRAAAGRGAQIICLKELFDAPYFCKSQQFERFDLAEAIPGPTTDAMVRLARELAVVLVVPVFERQAAGRVPQFGGGHRRRRQHPRRLSQDAHP